jgi:hypothetical protein
MWKNQTVFTREGNRFSSHPISSTTLVSVTTSKDFTVARTPCKTLKLSLVLLALDQKLARYNRMSLGSGRLVEGYTFGHT